MPLQSFCLLAAGVFWKVVLGAAILGVISSTVFLGMALVAGIRYRRRASGPTSSSDAVLPFVTLLKPVHGLEPQLFENLESFFQQDYPAFEILIGARDALNPALSIARAVCEKYPNVKSRVILSGSPTWPNAKVFSLDKMIRSSQSEFYVISDSDIRVERHFLRRVILPLMNAETGLVTCLYRGISTGHFWSTLEALGMSVELPSGVLVADMMEGTRFALGAVMAVRREALIKIGGIGTTADYYSDDFVLGNKIWKAGYKIELTEPGVSHVLMPGSWTDSLGSQLRWMQSTRYSRPLGHIGTGLTYAMPFGILGLTAALVTGRAALGAVLLAIAVVSSFVQCIGIGWGVMRDRAVLRTWWLYPLRNLLGFFSWAGSFASRTFLWRGEIYRFGRGGRITPQHRPAKSAAGEPL